MTSVPTYSYFIDLTERATLVPYCFGFIFCKLEKITSQRYKICSQCYIAYLSVILLATHVEIRWWLRYQIRWGAQWTWHDGYVLKFLINWRHIWELLTNFCAISESTVAQPNGAWGLIVACYWWVGERLLEMILYLQKIAYRLFCDSIHFDILLPLTWKMRLAGDGDDIASCLQMQLINA